MVELQQFSALQPPREPAPENAWSRDLVITLVAFTLCAVAGLTVSGGAGILAALIALPLIVRRHYPMLMLYGSTVGALLQLPLGDIQFSVVVVPFVIYQVARWIEPPNAARLSVIFGVVGSVLGPLAWTSFGTTLQVDSPDLMVYCFTCLVTVLTAYVIGRRRYEAVRSSDDRKVAAETTLRMQLAASEQRARAAEVNERNRIARELHDIVAHSLSVIVVQAEGGRALAAKKPELAADVLDTIAETSRESLVEMRRIVGVLRNGPERTSADYKPAPGLPDLPDLVARTTDRARLEVRGHVPAVSQTLGLTVYRVVQEALTNMLKHGGPDARATVLLDCSRPGTLELRVVDDGRGSGTTSDGQGNGLRGMNERVQLVGGRLRAHPRPEGGFEIRATFPLTPRSSGSDARAAATPDPGTPPRPSWATAPAPRPRTPAPSPTRPHGSSRPTDPPRADGTGAGPTDQRRTGPQGPGPSAWGAHPSTHQRNGQPWEGPAQEAAVGRSRSQDPRTSGVEDAAPLPRVADPAGRRRAPRQPPAPTSGSLPVSPADAARNGSVDGAAPVRPLSQRRSWGERGGAPEPSQQAALPRWRQEGSLRPTATEPPERAPVSPARPGRDRSTGTDEATVAIDVQPTAPLDERRTASRGSDAEPTVQLGPELEPTQVLPAVPGPPRPERGRP